ncbi:hypothetical protein C8Q77DRAFT_251600 [Trametes polyzona]|nr:hypothetical protein C8Q77DRAFT_251600 [Trametes polyzona]
MSISDVLQTLTPLRHSAPRRDKHVSCPGRRPSPASTPPFAISSPSSISNLPRVSRPHAMRCSPRHYVGGCAGDVRHPVVHIQRATYPIHNLALKFTALCALPACLVTEYGMHDAPSMRVHARATRPRDSGGWGMCHCRAGGMFVHWARRATGTGGRQRPRENSISRALLPKSPLPDPGPQSAGACYVPSRRRPSFLVTRPHNRLQRAKAR